MGRRYCVEQLNIGRVTLDESQSRHLRDVIRARPGDRVELFDGRGNVAQATVVDASRCVEVDVVAIVNAQDSAGRLIIASAVPKGARADWLIEKLSEFGVSEYWPLRTERSVVHPEEGKLSRWRRLAIESAKQCGRSELMQINGLISLDELPRIRADERWCLATEFRGDSALDAVGTPGRSLLAIVGPEGGWTSKELTMLKEMGFRFVTLTSTILRIETAAVAIASLVMVAVETGRTQGHRERQ